MTRKKKLFLGFVFGCLFLGLGFSAWYDYALAEFQKETIPVLRERERQARLRQ